MLWLFASVQRGTVGLASFPAQANTECTVCSVLNQMFRLSKLNGSICIRHPIMPCVLGICECCGDQKSVLDVCSVFVEVL